MEVEKLGEESWFGVEHNGKRYTLVRRVNVVGGMETPEEWEVLDEDGEDLAIQSNKRDTELSDKLIKAVEGAG